ncbi:hypothetical protein HXX76_015171 [Chlamydomonas incerta]|uniref:Uncharacterized protein n=1 Tax=Chlamydomonas incerta TaxID=51695 RepID=A0A835SB13_CHLIN|nr:hypothetical protein HXX76_015171 [Chlamydomonas incerta]|eukprot:KAG2423654.1 hypothetical protein HXX76_015171 [Chlamydomonas incerta]
MAAASPTRGGTDGSPNGNGGGGQGAGGGGGGGGRELPPLAIGGEGKDMVHEILAAAGPGGIAQVQEACLLPHPLVRHLLGMCEVLEVSRGEAHKAVLQRAKERLLGRVAALDGKSSGGGGGGGGGAASDKARLERLLAASFTYLGMAEMREVPLAVMERLERVPAQHLKQLAADTEVFKILPPGVQRQVWEYDKNLLQADALPLVGAYKYETATYMRGLAQDEFLPAVTAAGRRLAAQLLTQGPAAPAGAGGGAGGKGGKGGAAPKARGAGAAAAAAAAGVGGAHMLGPSALGGGGGGGPVGGGGITRKILRKGSRITQALKGMVGSSPKIYNQIVELCCVKFRDAEGLYVGPRETSYAALRSQLLMALHDDNNPVAGRDRCHELAWTLDAGIRAGGLSDKHLEKLGRFFADILAAEEEAAEERGGGGGGKRRRGATGALPGGAGAGGRRAPLDEAESAGAGGHGGGAGGVVEPLRVLGDAGVILRDPSALHLLAAQALALMQSEAIACERLPRDVPELCLVLRLMGLAVECRSMMRDRSYRFPEPDRVVLHDLLPLLAGIAVDFHTAAAEAAAAEAAGGAGGGAAAGARPGGAAAAAAAGGGAAAAAGGGGAGGVPAAVGPEPNAIVSPEAAAMEWPDEGTHSRVVTALKSNEVARRLMQTFALERLARGDYLGATKVLLLLARALVDGCLAVEGADFGASLAIRLAELVKARRLGPGSALWLAGVDNIAVRCVDAHTQTHEEVLRLLLAAALPAPVPGGGSGPDRPPPAPPLLTAAEVDRYLATTLERSKKSRKRYKKFSGGDGGGHAASLNRFPMCLLASDIGSDIGSDGWPGILQLKLKGADGVRSVYEMFRRVPGISPDNAPALFAYLAEAAKQ